jgi:hypothetical protein
MLVWTGVATAAIALGWASGLAGDTWREAYAAAAHASRPQMPASAIDQGYAAMAADLVRVGLLALIALAGLLLCLRGTIKPAVACAIVGLVTLFDLLPIDSRLMAPVPGRR